MSYVGCPVIGRPRQLALQHAKGPASLRLVPWAGARAFLRAEHTLNSGRAGGKRIFSLFLPTTSFLP